MVSTSWRRAAQLQGRDETNVGEETARMQGKANAMQTPITLLEIEQIITLCGGQGHAQT